MLLTILAAVIMIIGAIILCVGCCNGGCKKKEAAS